MPAQLSEPAKKFLEEYVAIQSSKEGEISGGTTEFVHVSHITRGLGFFYEKIRNTLDYKEEALWAKNTILRILLRREIQFLAGEPLGLVMIKELIRGRYLENDAVPVGIADVIDQILAKYRLLWERTIKSALVRKGGARKTADWILMLAACELEETLRKSLRDTLAIEFLYRTLRDRIEFPSEVCDPDECKLQMYLASFRTVMQADFDMESWTLFRLYFPEWKQASDDLILAVARDIEGIRMRIERALRWSFRRDLDRIFRRRGLLITLFRDIVDEHVTESEKVLAEPDRLESSLRAAYERRYNENRKRLRRSAWRAIFFIFLTKMLIAILAEIPYEIWTAGTVRYGSLAINVALPPLVLLIASLSIRMPGEEQNFARLLVEFNQLISSDTAPLHAVRTKKRKSMLAHISIGFLYVTNFLITFGALVWIARRLGFNMVSTGLFVLFLSLVSFFAIRLRKTANDLAAVEEKEHWGRSMFDFLFFPIVEVGRLLNLGLRSVNVVAFVFDYLLEAPYQSFIEMLEEWFSFLRERKEAL